MKLEIDRLYYNEIDVEKSKFLAYFFPIKSKEDFLNEFNKIKKEHNKARHHCYAYKIGNVLKYSDDGEPQGTAGKPILGVITNKNLDNCAIVVVRYFGGTLLGSGRLLRTYSTSASLVVDKAKLFEMVQELEITVEIDIDFYDTFRNYLNKNFFNIKKVVFNDKILIVFITPLSFNEDLNSVFYPKLKLIDKKIVENVKED